MYFYVLPFVFVIITLYFTYHLIQGERGIFRLFQVNHELVEAQSLLEKTEQEKIRMEEKVKSFYSASFSSDRLEEVARQELGVINPDEFVVFE